MSEKNPFVAGARVAVDSGIGYYQYRQAIIERVTPKGWFLLHGETEIWKPFLTGAGRWRAYHKKDDFRSVEPWAEAEGSRLFHRWSELRRKLTDLPLAAMTDSLLDKIEPILDAALSDPSP